MISAFIRRGAGPAISLAIALAAGVAGCTAAAAPTASTSVPSVIPMTTPMATAMSMPTRAPNVSATPVATTSVTIQNFAFVPPAIVVKTGSTVVWTNRDLEQHTVTARDHAYSSDALNQGQTFTMTFAKPGTYQYFCEIHPHMVGTVVVQ